MSEKLVPKKILWIEDDYYFIKGLADPLTEIGFEIIPARSFIEAKERLDISDNYDLIILDLIIPYSENEKFDGMDKNSDINIVHARQGLNMFNYLIGDLKFAKPILVFSIVKTKKVLDLLLKAPNVKIVYKVGKLPEDFKELVLEILNNRGT